MQLFYQYMAIFFNLPPTSNHLRSLQVENCDSNSRLVLDEDDNGKFMSERVKLYKTTIRIFTALNEPHTSKIMAVYELYFLNNLCI